MLAEVLVAAENALRGFPVIDKDKVDVCLGSFAAVLLPEDDGRVGEELAEEQPGVFFYNAAFDLADGAVVFADGEGDVVEPGGKFGEAVRVGVE